MKLLSILIVGLTIFVESKHSKHKKSKNLLNPSCNTMFCDAELSPDGVACNSTVPIISCPSFTHNLQGDKKIEIHSSCSSMKARNPFSSKEYSCSCIYSTEGDGYCAESPDCADLVGDYHTCVASTDCDTGYICGDSCCGLKCLKTCSTDDTTTTDKPCTKTPDTSEEPNTSEEPTPSTSEEPEPSTSEEPEPSTSEEPEPSTSEEPAPSTSEEPEPSTSEEPAPSTSEEPEPSTSEEPAPSTSEEPEPSTSEEPEPSTSEVPVASTSEQPVASTSEQPVATTTEQAVGTTSGARSNHPTQLTPLVIHVIIGS
jgi:hypothetical protein